VQTSSTQVHYFLGVYTPATPDTSSPSSTGTYLFRATGSPGANNTFTNAMPVLRGGLMWSSAQPLFSSGTGKYSVMVSFYMTPDTGLAPVTSQSVNVLVTQLFLRNTL
jgi:hypothetical protein